MTDDAHSLAAIENLMREVSELRHRVAKGERSHDLTRAAIDSGPGLEVINPETGEVAWRVGADENGVVIPEVLSGPDPIQPSAPTVEPTLGAIGVNWDGLDVEGNAAPADFESLRIYVSVEEDFTPSEATFAGAIHSKGGHATVALGAGTWFVRTETVTLSGKVSPASEAVEAVLTSLVDEASISEQLEQAADDLREAHNMAIDALDALDSRTAEGEAALEAARERLAEAERVLEPLPGDLADAKQAASDAADAAIAAEARATEANNRAMTRLANGNFEAGLLYWKSLYSSLTEDAHSGVQAVELAPGGRIIPESPLPVVEGQIWEVTFVTKPLAAPTGSGILLSFNRPGQEDTGPSLLSRYVKGTPDAWTDSGSIRFTVPADVDQLSFRIVVPWAETVSYAVDDVTLRDVTDVVRLEQAAQEAKKAGQDAASAAAAVQLRVDGVDSRLDAAESRTEAVADEAAEALSDLDTALTNAFKQADSSVLTSAQSDAKAKADAAELAAKTAAALDAQAKANAARQAAEATAATDAKAKADAALIAAKADAKDKADAAQQAAVIAAAADAKAKTEAAEARAAAEALRLAQQEAQREANEAETAAKEYADAQASGTSGAALESAKRYAEEQAEEARKAAEAAAALDATAKKEQAEATAAADAKVKADKALADAKTDATSKANAAELAAKNAAAADATSKANAAQAEAARLAAIDAKTKADAAQAEALRLAKLDATQKANAAEAAAIGAAAADAQTKFDVAKKLADDAAARAEAILKRGDNLVVNGSAELGTSAGWPAIVVPALDQTPSGYAGAFTLSGATTTWSGGQTERISVDPARSYRHSVAIKGKPGMYHYGVLYQQDVDGADISHQNAYHTLASETKLAQPVKNGDTRIVLENASGWTTTNANVARIGVFPYATQAGPVYTIKDGYTRHVTPSGITAVSGNVVTLASPWTLGPFEAGRDIAQMAIGGNYLYPWSTPHTVDGWQTFTGTTVPGVSDGLFPVKSARQLRPGAATVSVGFLMNYQNRVPEKPYFTGVRLVDATDEQGVTQALADAKAAQSTADKAEKDAATAHTAAGSAQSSADAAMTRASTAETNAKSHADGLPKVLHGTTAATGTAPNGSIWWQHQGTLSGRVIGQWNRVNNAWVSTPIDSAAIANLDVGKLTAGSAEVAELVTQKLLANEAVIKRLTVDAQAWIDGVLIKDKTVTADQITVTNELITDIFGANRALIEDELVVKGNLIANNADIIAASMANLTVTEKAAFADAYADQFWAKMAVVEKLQATTAWIGGALLQDNAITVENINVTSALTAELLRVRKVQGNEIDGNTFTGNTFNGGTFTGAKFQTTSTPRRGVELDAGGLRAWNASGSAETFSINATDGSVSMEGELSRKTGTGLSATEIALRDGYYGPGVYAKVAGTEVGGLSTGIGGVALQGTSTGYSYPSVVEVVDHMAALTSAISDSTNAQYGFVTLNNQRASVGHSTGDLTLSGNRVLAQVGAREAEPVVTTGTWRNISRVNGWANVSGRPVARYRIEGNTLRLSGAVVNGTSGLIGTLPVGFRPTYAVDASATKPNSQDIARITVGFNGQITVNTLTGVSGTYISLDGITIPLD